jgi:hypothetical protein
MLSFSLVSGFFSSHFAVSTFSSLRTSAFVSFLASNLYAKLVPKSLQRGASFAI